MPPASENLRPVNLPPATLGPAVEVTDLTVTYRTNFQKTPTLKEFVSRPARRRGVREIQALRGVSLTVPSGMVLGVIGANGAGKSTLLRAIAGILPPSQGRIVVRGQVSALLSLGVGFNKSLNGRDNILLGGLAAGVEPADIEERFNDIVAFADIGEFIDLPMKTYSSGMYSRLAFAVAAHMDPDVLLVDEALATGDAAFRRKCKRKMQDLCARAGTILLVSHGLASIRDMADDCLWLHQGRISAYGDPGTVLQEYTDYMHVENAVAAGEEEDV